MKSHLGFNIHYKKKFRQIFKITINSNEIITSIWIDLMRELSEQSKCQLTNYNHYKKLIALNLKTTLHPKQIRLIILTLIMLQLKRKLKRHLSNDNI